MNFRKLLGIAAAAMLALSLPALAQTLPYVQKVGPTDAIQVVPNGQPTSQAQYATTLELNGFAQSQYNRLNILVGGDATTNLFQRGTTGSSVTTAITYGGPDRWAYWSGASTAMTVSRDATAADLPATGFKYGFIMQRTSGQTGVIPVCMTQEVESANSYLFQGQVAEVDFTATAGANFSAANGAMTAYIITGTGTDEGVSKMAFAFNGGGGGSSTWAGQATTVADVATLTTTPTRFAAVGVIPATATEVGVVFCYTPVGTAGTNDYVALSGIQLTRNGTLASVAASTVAMPCTTINCASLDRRPQALETSYQERYAYGIAEPAAGVGVGVTGVLSSTTTCDMSLPLPVTMRAAPTVTFTGTALSTATWRIQDSTTSTLATPFLAQLTTNPVEALNIRATLTTASTAGWACQLQGAAGGGNIIVSAEL